MRLMALGDETIGQVVAKTIFTSDGRALIKAGTVLTAKLQTALRSWGYAQIYIQDELFPDLPSDADIGDETRRVALTSFREVVKGLERSKITDIGPLKSTIEGMIADIQDNPQSLFYLSSLKTTDDITFTHSINVAVISLLLGQNQYLPREMLLKLGIGALLHDVGKTRIPLEILNKPDKLTPEEYESAKEHTLLGYQLLNRETTGLSPLSTNVALAHHERLDGSGYPRQIKGDEIHLFSKIVAVADVWDALISKRQYREEWSPFEAAEYLREGAGTLFHPEIVGHLFKRMALFPVGSIVRLSDGRLGVVTDQQPLDPEHPPVSIVADRENRLIAPGPVALTWEADLYVKSVLNRYPPEIERKLNARGTP